MNSQNKAVLLEFVENQADMSLAAAMQYKKYNQAYISCNNSFYSILRHGINNSEIRIYPSSEMKLWVLWLLQILGFQKDKNTMKLFNLLGLLGSWLFIKKTTLPINIDIIFVKTRFFILIKSSASNRYVVKLRRNEEGTVRLNNELVSLQLANRVDSQKTSVISPRILESKPEAGYIKMEFLEGVSLGLSTTNQLKSITDEVANFMLNFYLVNGTRLISLLDFEYKKDDRVIDYISSKALGDEVLKIYASLCEVNKKLLYSRIHGDLGINNILIDSENYIKLIDWEKSKNYLVAEDLKSSLFDSSKTYSTLITQLDISSEEKAQVFSLEEQLFVAMYLKLYEFTYNAINRDAMNQRHITSIDNNIKRVYNFSKSLNRDNE